MATEQLPEVWTIQALLQWSSGYLERFGSPSPRLDAELLLCKALDCERIHLYMDFAKPIAPGERGTYRQFLKRRAKGEPIAYISGRKEFMGLSFQVTPEVLIPRPDTECLIEICEKTIKEEYQNTSALRILDCGSGSGCISISLAHRLRKRIPELMLVGVDISVGALEVAQINAKNLGVEESVRFVLGDMCSLPHDLGLFDLIVSNPPYIAIEEKPDLPRSVVSYEPELALFAPENGLQFYKALLDNLPQTLSIGGWFMVEIGSKQGPSVRQLFLDHGLLRVQVIKDYNGLERVVIGQRL